MSTHDRAGPWVDTDDHDRVWRDCEAIARADALAAITARVVAEVPGADYAGIVGGAYLADRPRDEQPDHVPVVTLDQLYTATPDGPGRSAVREHHCERITDLRRETRWPEFVAQASTLGVRCALCLPFTCPSAGHGVLNVYGSAAGGFDANAENVLSKFAAQAEAVLSQQGSGSAVPGRAESPAVAPRPTHHGVHTDDRQAVEDEGRSAEIAAAAIRDHLPEPDARTERLYPRDRTSHRCGQNLELACTRTSSSLILHVTGEVDLANASELSATLHNIALGCGDRRITLDLTGAGFISVSGFEALHSVAQRCGEDDPSITLVATAEVIRLLRLLGMDSEFVCHTAVRE
ncbi:STAS domain-containing protein [Rhodococcus sp. D2-41]|uniref:STAS domain-containing protein n=1 Tax=Speluncibacter jeojiensis TaxID=2710754 RepID=A0A9X4RIU5_9ACTN|nr:STAS domain-containing protein [Rhodococcus sp. D2-41]MDG3009533.1 STAS domain-containing protein [Rhodococcus sp. D2-41]MDG3016461.1 STAS domain-containing protein [Corynebacteriales bacterium D3-21]